MSRSRFALSAEGFSAFVPRRKPILEGDAMIVDIAAAQHLQCPGKWLNSMQMIGRLNSEH
jgi:hypothetical protein